jgi:hypothetical protein
MFDVVVACLPDSGASSLIACLLCVGAKLLIACSLLIVLHLFFAVAGFGGWPSYFQRGTNPMCLQSYHCVTIGLSRIMLCKKYLRAGLRW